MRKVGVEKGVEWIGEGFRILRAHPAEFLAMGLIYTLVSIIPFVGSVVILLLGPALLGGMVYASQQAATGRKPQVGHLFRAFQEGDRVGSFVALCLPFIGAMIILVILFMPFLAAVFHAAQSGQINLQDNTDPAALAAVLRPVFSGMIGRLAISFLISIVVLFLAGMLTFFAAARVMLAHKPAFAAMKASFSACLRNFGAYFILVLLLGVGMAVLRLVLSRLFPDLFAALLSNIPFNALLGPIVYVAYHSIFGEDSGAGDEAPEPVPPSPSHTIEA